MIKPIKITGEMLTVARDRAAEMGKLKNSIINGAGNLVGALGEEIFAEYFGRDILEPVFNYDYDFITQDGNSIDVKSKRTSVEPLPHYECTVSGLNTKQKTDFYAFCRIKDDYTVGWVLGLLRKDKFFKRAAFYKKGEKDPSNRFVCKTDMYSVRIDELDDF